MYCIDQPYFAVIHGGEQILGVHNEGEDVRNLAVLEEHTDFLGQG
jgi:hypothetical protein